MRLKYQINCDKPELCFKSLVRTFKSWGIDTKESLLRQFTLLDYVSELGPGELCSGDTVL